MPCSLQSTAHSLCFASPLIYSMPSRHHYCSPCRLYHSPCHLYHSTRCLSHLAQCYRSMSLTSSPLHHPYHWDLRLCSNSPFVVVSTNTLVYPIVGSHTPPLILLTVISLSSQPSTLSLDSLATPSIQSSWATIVYYLSRKLITDSRTPTTSRTPLDLHCLGQLPTPP